MRPGGDSSAAAGMARSRATDPHVAFSNVQRAEELGRLGEGSSIASERAGTVPEQYILISTCRGYRA
jgi:hypothetical protein